MSAKEIKQIHKKSGRKECSGMIGCIAAMPSELKAITDRMSEKHEDHIGKMVFVRGKLEGLDTVAVLSGWGKWLQRWQPLCSAINMI